MNLERKFKVILAPHVSEKATMSAEDGTIVLKVVNDATKVEIKNAVEQMFDVKVTNVRTSVVKGKTKRTGARTGRRSDWKKAYVSLAEGSDIDFAGVEG
jgi:large subunit ribosomal protein L23